MDNSDSASDSIGDTNSIDIRSDAASALTAGPFLSRLQLDHDVIKSYYTAYVGLYNGSSSRQALSLEIALYICRLAGFERWGTKRALEGYEIHAQDSEVESFVWFHFGPFTKQALNHIKSVQLVTMSRHQGWVSNRNAGSWSWFELRVARPKDEDVTRAEVKRRVDGDEMSWCSHRHPVDPETAQQQKDYAEHKGVVFDSDHKLWEEVREGDVLQVVMKAQFGGWSNTVSDGMLRINIWWEPSVEMLDLMRRGNV
ncbi:unnamed protein product [Rhizoctonia solani]|uniref:Uncharacterized protein n=1 Tax=Rhizoctonia solani TaxID=456999 RepID=A0A8H2XAW6_9AGAM|nr:unnamed protein product [Rhizoctonia solani]